jgi:hypothetical protein
MSPFDRMQAETEAQVAAMGHHTPGASASAEIGILRELLQLERAEHKTEIAYWKAADMLDSAIDVANHDAIVKYGSLERAARNSWTGAQERAGVARDALDRVLAAQVSA